MVRKAPGVFAAGPDAADVDPFQVGKAEGGNRGPRSFDPFPVLAGHIRVEAAVVVHHHHAVLRDADIHLQRVDAELERVAERRQRVLRQVAARAAVALDIHL